MQSRISLTAIVLHVQMQLLNCSLILLRGHSDLIDRRQVRTSLGVVHDVHRSFKIRHSNASDVRTQQQILDRLIILAKGSLDVGDAQDHLLHGD